MMRTVMSSARASWRALLLVILASLAGCASNDLEDLQRFVNETKSKFKGQVVPMPEAQGYSRYNYHTGDMRDPFRLTPAAVKMATRGGPGPDMRRPREELEKYPLDALQMAGVLRKDGETWALIKSPDGSIHRVRRGNYLGQNFGKIENISDTRVDVTEMVSNGTGGWTKHANALVLNRN